MKKVRNILLSVSFAVCLAVTSYCAPVMADVTASYKERENDSAELQKNAVVMAEIVPGLNMLTGSELPVTFSNGSVSPASVQGSELSVTDSPVSTDKDNKVLAVKPVSKWNAAKFVLPATVEKERPIKVSFKAYKKTADGVGTDTSLWIMKNGTSVWQKVYTYNKFESNTDSWHDITYNCETFDKLVNSSTNAPDTSNTHTILLEWTVHSDICDSSNKVTDASKQIVYFDDISFVPAHKITYMDDKNKAIRTEYKFLEAGEIFSPKVTSQDRENFIIGWSQSQNSAATDSVTVHNSDIVLYAVYSDEIIVKITSDCNLIDRVNKSITLKSNLLSHNADTSSITKSFSLVNGTDVVSLYDNGNGTAKVTALKEGFATVRCTLSSGETCNYPVAVKFADNASGENEKRVEMNLSNIDPGSYKLDHINLSYYDSTNKVLVVQRDSTVTGNGFINFWHKYKLSEYPYLLIEMKCETNTVFQLPFCDTTNSWFYYTNYGFGNPNLPSSSDYVVHAINMQERFVGTSANGRPTLESVNGFVVGVTNHYKPVYIKSIAISNVLPTTALRTIKLISDKTTIDSDGEKLTLTGEIFSNKPLENKNLTWSIDNDNALLIDNGDGTATLEGIKNGKVKVTVTDADYPENSSTVEFVISNQREKVAVYDFRVLFWGCSTLKHGPSSSLAWTGNWGMAATKEENDYAHKFIKYLEEAFPNSNVSFQMSVTGAAFDLTIKGDTNNTVNYANTETYIDIKNKLESFEPNIFIAGQTENLSATYNVESGKRGYRELYEMIYEKNPNIIALQQHCGISHAPLKEEVNDYLAEYFKPNGYIRWHTDMPGNPIYYAPEWNEIGQPGVAGHPGDYGMDFMARTMLDLVMDDIYRKISPTDYIYLPESLNISGSNTISTKGGKSELRVTAYPSDASDKVNFTVDDENIATVDENGVVTAKNNGKVTVTATSKYDKSVSAVFVITVSGQQESFSVSYDGGCDDEVTNLPETAEFVRGDFELSTKVPSRKFYTFDGWSLEKNGENKVTSLDVTQNTTVYATWKKTTGFEFDGNYDEFAGFLYDFSIKGGFHSAVTEGRLTAVCSLGEKVRFISPELDIANEGFVEIVLESEYYDDSSSIDVKITDSKGKTLEESFVLDSLDSEKYVVDTIGLSGTIKGIEIYVNAAPTDDSMFGIYVDYIRFSDNVSVDENGYIVTYSDVSIRTVSPIGLRTMAGVYRNNDIMNSVTEYGMIISTKSIIDYSKLSDIVLDETLVSERKILKAVAFNKSENINVVFENTATETIFAAVLYGIPKDKFSYKEKILFRPYYITEDSEGNRNVFYGKTKAMSLYEAAKLISENDELVEEQRKVINDIIDIVE